MHVFILRSFWQSINKPCCVLASQYVSLFSLQQSSCSLNFLVLTSFVLKGTWIWLHFFFKWEIICEVHYGIFGTGCQKKKKMGFCGVCVKTHASILVKIVALLLTVNRDHFLIDSAADICSGYSSSELLLLHAMLGSRETSTLDSCHMACSLWISARLCIHWPFYKMLFKMHLHWILNPNGLKSHQVSWIKSHPVSRSMWPIVIFCQSIN